MQSLHARSWLAIKGRSLPVTFEAIKQDYTARSQADDAGDLLLDPLFEIPIETVRSAIGYYREAAPVGRLSLTVRSGNWPRSCFTDEMMRRRVEAAPSQAHRLRHSATALDENVREIKQTDRRGHLDLQIDLLAEREMTAVLRLLRDIAAHLKVQSSVTSEQLRDLAKRTDLHQLTSRMAEFDDEEPHKAS